MIQALVSACRVLTLVLSWEVRGHGENLSLSETREGGSLHADPKCLALGSDSNSDSVSSARALYRRALWPSGGVYFKFPPTSEETE